MQNEQCASLGQCILLLEEIHSVSGASVGQTSEEDTHLIRVKDVSGLVEGSYWQNYVLSYKKIIVNPRFLPLRASLI